MKRNIFRLASTTLLMIATLLFPQQSLAGRTWCGTEFPDCASGDSACWDKAGEIIMACNYNEVCMSCVRLCYPHMPAKLTPIKKLDQINLNEFVGPPEDYYPCIDCASWDSFDTPVSSQESFCTGKDTSGDTGSEDQPNDGEQPDEDQIEGGQTGNDPVVTPLATEQPQSPIIVTASKEESDDGNEDHDRRRHHEKKKSNHKKVLPKTGMDFPLVETIASLQAYISNFKEICHY